MTSNYISYSSLDSSTAPRFNHGTVLWPELGSECCTLGGPDLFSVQCSDLGALQCSFQCSHSDSDLQSQCGTVLWPELGSECCSLGGPDLFFVQCSDLGAL